MSRESRRTRTVDKSRRTASRTLPAVQRPKSLELKKVRAATDGYNNLIARLGPDQVNSMSAGYHSNDGLTARWQELTTMYRENWLTKKIIDMPAEDMTKSWISIDTQLSEDGIDRIEKEFRQFRIQKRMTDAVKWSRLYGGSLAIILIDGEEDMMHEPLNLVLVMPGSFRGLIIKDRWDEVEPSMDLVTDMLDPDFGFPMWYTVGETNEDVSQSRAVKIHHSRIIRFVGRELPRAEEENEMYWGASELEHIFDELEKRNATSANIAQLVFQANLRVLKMSDLGQLLAMSDQRTQNELYATIQAQNVLMTSFGLQVLDQDDSFETHPYAFAGLNDIYQSFQGDISGAAEIPATKLFGKSPDGMNSTGEGDMKNYYDSIVQKQENTLRPALEKLLPIICVSALGAVPDDIEVVFEPVEAATEEQKSALAVAVTGAITSLYQSDLITKAMAMQELKKSAFATGVGSVITDEDIEKAEEESQLMAEQNAMGGGMGEGMPGMMGEEQAGQEQVPPQEQPSMQGQPQQQPPQEPQMQDEQAVENPIDERQEIISGIRERIALIEKYKNSILAG